jgi:hypothetical protein
MPLGLGRRSPAISTMRPRNAAAALQLAATEHHAIRWCTQEELRVLSPPLSGAVQWYCEQAIREVGR